MHAFRLTPAASWAVAAPDEPYGAPSLATEGFVHLTHGVDDLLAAGDRHYRDDPRPYLALAIDLDRLTVPWRYDGDERFPHAYGPLDRVAVTGVHPIVRGADGRFLSLEPPASPDGP